MLWSLRWSDKIDWLEDLETEQGREVKALAEQPELGEHLQWVYQAFWDLTGDRQIGFGEGPIPWLAIDAYARRHRVRNEKFDRLVKLLRRMDSAYLRERNKKVDGVA